jgi:large subunit ribosomal protein L35
MIFQSIFCCENDTQFSKPVKNRGSNIMPKLKTHSASKKRFRITANGKVKMNHAFRSHRLISKSKKARKQHRLGAYASSANAAIIKKLIPYK